MSKFIYIIFLPMVLSVPYNQLTKDFQTVHELNDIMVKNLEPSTSGSTTIMVMNITVACSNESLIDGTKQKREDYQYTPGIGAHKLHTRGLTFNNARKICIEEGGHLAIINSLGEEQVLLGLINGSKTFLNVENEEQVFIGIHDLFAEGDWVTILGEPLSTTGYSKWSDTWWSGQPDNLGGNQNCGSLLKQGGMDDVNCNSIFAFICEIPEI